jgi:hypothetical protein
MNTRNRQNMPSKAARWAGLIGGGLGTVILLNILTGQLNLGRVLSGDMPLGVAIVIAGKGLVLLSLLTLVCIIGTMVALWPKVPRVLSGAIWLGIGGILAMVAYMTPFSIGFLLVPSMGLFLIAGGLAIWRRA